MEKQTILLPEEEIKTIRSFANAVADDSDLVNSIACYLYDIAKDGKKELSQETLSSMHVMPLEEAHNIPRDISSFLKTNMVARGSKATGTKKIRMQRLILFVHSIREAVINLLEKDNIMFSSEDIKNFSEIFNMKYVRTHIYSPKSSNTLRLIIAVALSDNDRFSVFELNQNMLKHAEFLFRLANEDQMQSLFEVYNLYFKPKSN